MKTFILLYQHLKTYVLAATIPAILFACDKQELETITAKQTGIDNLRIRKNLLVEGTFETKDMSQFDRFEGASHELVVQHRFYRSYPNSIRVEVNSNENNIGGKGWRAELVQYDAGGPNKDKERWFGFSIRVPEDWRVIDSTKSTDIFLQIHDRPDPCETYRTPPLALLIDQNKFTALAYSDSNPCSANVYPRGKGTTRQTVMEQPLIKGKWVDWVIHVKWSYKNDGLLEIWQDGRKVTTYKGPIGYNDTKSMYLKTGLYHISNGDGWPKGLKRRVLYYDDIRMGNQQASYADVKPFK
ncbi:MAG: polysaccharide lyase [Bacteroidota bacterium]|nr:polysaccharide lyase [Bacteroidota bacterium]